MNAPAKKSRKRADAPGPPDPLAPAAAQRELAAAPVPPAANDEARAAIATINTQLSEFDKVEAGLGVLEQRYAKVAYAVDTKDGMKDAVEARREIKGVRVEVEHAREAAKAPVLKLGREIDARAGTIKTRLLTLETPIDDQIKAQERKEAERKADLERRILEIEKTPRQCIGKTAAQLQEVLEGLDSLPLADFEEFRERAAHAQFGASQAVGTLLQQAKQAEELADLQAKQRLEEARKNTLQQRVDAIANPLRLPYRTSERVQQAIDRLQAVEIGADFEEFAPAAREEKVRVLAELTRIRDKSKADEDARAAAAAAPAPSPAPAVSYRPLTAEQAIVDGAPVGAARVRVYEPLGRSAQDDDRVLAGDSDPFTAPVRSVLGYETVKTGSDSGVFASPEAAAAVREAMRPQDAEILSIVADHYEVDAATAAAWLRTFDADAALRQLALPIV